MRCVRFAIVAAFAFACAPAQTPELAVSIDDLVPTVDTDGDGRPDCVDVDQDGLCTAEDRNVPRRCRPRPIDIDGDGAFEGVDTNCDGIADVCRSRVDTDGDGQVDGI